MFKAITFARRTTSDYFLLWFFHNEHVLCFSYHCCVTDHGTLSGLKRQSFYCADKFFGSRRAGESRHSSVSACRVSDAAGGWCHPKAPSLTRLTPGRGVLEAWICLLVRLHVACPRGVGAFQRGGFRVAGLLTGQLRAPACAAQEAGRRCVAFSDLALEAVGCHFCCFSWA